MDPLQIKRLKEEYLKGLKFSEEKVKKWENFKADYETLNHRLETLPDQLSYDITVPLGENAFTKGKIVHTNEVMVLLGDNWFAEVSAKQAVRIATRRILQCTKMLGDLEKEKQQFQNWLDYIDKISENEDLVEIVEDYDEEKEKAWKEQHAMNVKSYRKQLVERKKREKDENGSDNESDEDYLSKLDELQLADSNGINDSEDDTSKEIDSKEIRSAEYAGNTAEYSDETCQIAESNGINDSEDDTSKSEIDAKEIRSAESVGSTLEYFDETSQIAESNGINDSEDDTSKSEIDSKEIRLTESVESTVEYFDEASQIAESNGINDSEDDTSKSEIDSKEIRSADSAGSTAEYSDETSHSEEHPEKPVLKLNINNRIRKASESETGDDWEDSHKGDWNCNMQEGTSPRNGKHVRWVDLSKQNIKKITFKHSKPKKPNTPSTKYKAVNPNEDENHPLIQSPSDIYKLFGNCLQSSPPKSILKVKTPSPSTDMNGPIFPTKDILSKESSPETDESVNLPFTGEVRERSAPINIVQNKSSRPTSHFKSSRKNRKR